MSIPWGKGWDESPTSSVLGLSRGEGDGLTLPNVLVGSGLALNRGAIGMVIAVNDARFFGGLTLLERHTCVPANYSSTEPAAEQRFRERVTSWRIRYFNRSRRRMKRYLASFGLDDARRRSLLEPLASYHAPWLQFAIDAEAADAHDTNVPSPNTRRVGQAVVALCQPLMAHARKTVGIARKAQGVIGSSFPDESLLPGFEAHLYHRLMPWLMPALVLEANLSRLSNLDSPQDATERFWAFAESFAAPNRRERFWAKYPVLLRFVVCVTQNALAAAQEMFERIAINRKLLEGEFGIGSTSALQSIQWGSGDSHRNGRSVAILHFADGHVVYKPRPMACDVGYQRFLQWYGEALSDAGAPKRSHVVNCGDYGFAAYVEHAPARSMEELTTFYGKIGQLIGIAWLLGITDLHHENLIACRTDPYLIDVETMFDRPVQRSRRPSYAAASAQAFKDLLLNTGLVPLRMLGPDGVCDLSAIGAVTEQPAPWERLQLEDIGRDDVHYVRSTMPMPPAQNSPFPSHDPGKSNLQGSPYTFVDEVLNGFERAITVFQRRRHELLGVASPVVACADAPVRWVARETRLYVELLEKIAHPSLCGDAVECEMLLGGQLTQPMRYAAYLTKLVASEAAALWQGDVPVFWTTAASTTLFAESNATWPDFFEQSGLAAFEQRLKSLPHALPAQLASLNATMRSTVPLPGAPTYVPFPHVATRGEQLLRHAALDEARRIGQLLIEQMHDVRGMPFAIGLIPLEELQYGAFVLPPDLYDGLPGIGVFLAYLARMTANERFEKCALRVHKLVRRLMRERAGVAACGAFNGLAGLIYADLHMGTALQRGPARESFAAFARLQHLIAADTHCDIISGAAGALLVALRFHQATGWPEAWQAAHAAADRLLALAEHCTVSTVAWHTLKKYEQRLGGLAHGVSGIAWAIAEWAAVAEVDNQLRWHDLVRRAFAFEQSLFDERLGTWIDARRGQPTCFWCYGAPGIGLAINQLRRVLGNKTCEDMMHLATDITWRNGLMNSHCLCHGNLGNLELFRLVGSEKRVTSTFDAILSDMRAKQHWSCGLPGDATTPGLMCGLAGIGYGLLRSTAPSSVPNLLLLEGVH